MSVKIAIFIPSLQGGGAEKVMLNLAEYLANDGCQVDLLIAHNCGPWTLSPSTKVNLINLNASKPSRAIFKLISYIRREKPFAIMSAMTHANIALAIAHKLSPGTQRCILSERADTLAIEREKHGFDKWMTKWAGRICYPWADEITAVSAGTAASVAKLFALKYEKINVIYNPIFSEDLLAKSKSPVDFPWKDDLPIIISVGRLNLQKNYLLLIKAYFQIQQRQPCHLVILGEGSEREAMTSLVRSLKIEKNVWMPGFIENPQAFIAKSKVFVLSSDYEGLPNVLIESLALGTPIVSTNCPSGPAEILCNGRYGTLVEPGNIEQLINAILTALSSGSPMFDKFEAISKFEPQKIVNDYKRVLGIQTT